MNVSKKMLPTLVGSALCMGPVMAQAQAQAQPQAQPPYTLTVYGTAHAQVESASVSGAEVPAQNKPARTRLQNVSSDLGFKATLKLTEEMTGVFQYTSGVNVDDGRTSLWGAAKDVFIGISFANVGTLKLGRLTGAARWISGTADFSASGAGPQDDQSMLTGASGQTADAPQFNARLDNSIGFETAKWAGFSGRVYFQANENKSNETAASGAQLSDTSYSLGLQYASGPVDVRVSYEERNDKGTLNKTTTNDTKDKNARIGLRYIFPTQTTLGFGYDLSSYTDRSATAANKTHLKKSGWVLAARQVLGDHVLFGGYGQAGDLRSCAIANGTVCDTADTGARSVTLGYQYNFNKQMMLEGFVSQVSNKARAKYDFDSGGVGAATGSDVSALGVGLRYTF
jgi:predicted porin